MFRYRNRDTAQVVEYPTRSVRLDALGYRWELIEQPAPVEVVEPVVEPAPDAESLPEWPGSRGSKAELVDYVVAHRLLVRAEAVALTRVELLDRYAPQD